MHRFIRRHARLMFNPKPELARLLQSYCVENHAGECGRRYAWRRLAQCRARWQA